MIITKITLPEDPKLGLKKIHMARLGQIVLITGKNGSGKSRVLSKIKSFLQVKPKKDLLQQSEEQIVDHLANQKKFQLARDSLEIEESLDPTNESIKAQIKKIDGRLDNVNNTLVTLNEHLTWDFIETSEASNAYSFVDFVPKILDLKDCNSFTKQQIVEHAKNLDPIGINNSPSGTLSKIQHLQDQWFNATHSHSTISDKEKQSIISKYENNEIYCSNITCNFENNKIPSRIKFGLDVGMRNLKSKLPCNICFNSKMGNPLIENKPGSFHWTPIFPNRNSVIAIGNFSTLKNYQRDSEIEMTFFRKEDSSTISKKFTLKANCEKRIYSNDADIKQFIKTEGWVTIKANNPYIQGFYFNFNNSGSVSGDHFF